MVEGMSERVSLAIGQPAPEFSLPDQNGRTVTLSGLRGTRIVLFAYPAAMTPACALEACDFRDSIEPLRAAGYTVLGISPDDPEKQKRFAERDGLDYPLLSDADHSVLTAYGAYGEKNSYGRIVVSVIRSTFVIDEEGRIEHALVNVRATGHVARLRKLLGV